MTNAELIQKIRNEIERLKGIEGIVPLDNREQKTGYESALIDVETFLDTLEESEKPINQESLEEDLTNDADKMFFSLGFYEGDHHQPMLDCISLEQFQGIARHFAQWGAEHAKSESEK